MIAKIRAWITTKKMVALLCVWATATTVLLAWGVFGTTPWEHDRLCQDALIQRRAVDRYRFVEPENTEPVPQRPGQVTVEIRPMRTGTPVAAGAPYPTPTATPAPAGYKRLAFWDAEVAKWCK